MPTNMYPSRRETASNLPDMTGACERARSLVDEMTFDEKMSLVATHFPFITPDAVERGMPMGSAYTPPIERLGIPSLRVVDASMGVANVMHMRPGDEATALPASLATGASFDPELAYAGGAMIGGEARAKTFNVLLGGGINLTRDSWAGRNFEYIGEDPLLSGLLGAAAVRGVQDQDVACTVKHLVLNSQETGRMAIDARIDEAALRESDLLAFEIAIEASRPASVMTAYNLINGDYASEHAELITGVLKQDWGYSGWTMSDWGAVHSTAKAAISGLDQESGMELDERLNGDVYFTHHLKAAIRDGDVPSERLDDMVVRILTGMIGCGLLDRPVSDSPQSIDYAANADVAQDVAEAGCVLLRNEDELLPLSRGSARIAVIGGHADLGVMSGGGSTQVRSVGGAPIEETLPDGDSSWFCRKTYHSSSPLRAIRAACPEANVDYADGDDLPVAIRLAAEADVAIVFATQWRTEGTDLLTLTLPDGQDHLIAAVAAANPRTVVVVQSGGAVLMPWREDVSAILAAWYPGQRGGEAIARLLFGEANPSGRLPLTFPASDRDGPRPQPPGLAEMRERDERKRAGDDGARIARFEANYDEGANVGYRWYEASGTVPMFPFGYGLSYTTFDYRDVVVIDGEKPSVQLTVANTGERAGADVPQIYVRAPDGSGVETWRLAGFRRVALVAGESARIAVDLEPRTFATWDLANRRWRMKSHSLRIAVGRSATDFVFETMLDGSAVRL